ncbi:hypothetical protein Salat_1197000 [Sesamum alatum]|uniref:Uncharacterized protein n=1 Tax=Sesamum alatum TaxID=300844 RepID=A0AAE1YF26_9LAMI|nr:hypothetical protein Salat_1197000 [Sesamum alatum]
MAHEMGKMKEALNFAEAENNSVMVPLGLWHGDAESQGFYQNLIALKIVEEDDDPATVELNWADFSVHVHSLSLGRMSRNMAAFIGNQLGIFRDVELESGGQFWGLSLRIRLGLNITKPLRRLNPASMRTRILSPLTLGFERQLQQTSNLVVQALLSTDPLHLSPCLATRLQQLQSEDNPYSTILLLSLAHLSISINRLPIPHILLRILPYYLLFPNLNR